MVSDGGRLAMVRKPSGRSTQQSEGHACRVRARVPLVKAVASSFFLLWLHFFKWPQPLPLPRSLTRSLISPRSFSRKWFRLRLPPPLLHKIQTRMWRAKTKDARERRKSSLHL